jgi:Raf kinase inhibitor-like YbhB/YbcL family protein
MIWLAFGVIKPTYEEKNLKVTCPAFEEGTHIPITYTCDGDNVNPAIYVNNIPADTKSLAIILEDRSAGSKPISHWLAWNIVVADSNVIPENSITGIEGTNSMGKHGYSGPCSPKDVHKYYFKVYALNSMLTLKDGANRNALEKMMKGHILRTGELMGHYKQREGLIKVIEAQTE